MKPTFLSLFAGIGGMDLGLERAGWRCIGQVEIDPFCRKVLAKHWPDVPKWGDIREFHGGLLSEKPDLICGGFPCQDVSFAGRRIGIDGARSGLWAEYARLIGEIRPGWVLVENVAGLLDRGMGRVVGEMAEIGYDAEWDVVPACAFGAPHPRERVFIVAYPACERQGQLRRLKCQSQGETQRDIHWAETEPGYPRMVDGIPARLDRITALGNAVVPQVAEWIGRRIIESMELSK
jgi:DNA (cytosine-5)-methyltransferase 1